MTLMRWDIIAKITSYLILSPVVFLGPLLTMTPHLFKARKNAEVLLSSFGRKLAGGVLERTRAFTSVSESSANIGYWNDLCQFSLVYNDVLKMKLWPFDTRSILRMLLTVIGPLVPLLLSNIPIFGDIIRVLFK